MIICGIKGRYTKEGNGKSLALQKWCPRLAPLRVTVRVGQSSIASASGQNSQKQGPFDFNG